MPSFFYSSVNGGLSMCAENTFTAHSQHNDQALIYSFQSWFLVSNQQNLPGIKAHFRVLQEVVLKG